MKLWKHGKVFYCFYKAILKNTRESKTSQPCLHALSSKHTYQPMGARVLAQLFYDIEL